MRFCILTLTLGALVLSPAAAQSWTGPFQLTNDTFADINPSACPEWVTGQSTYLVWQTNRNGNWDIYAKSCEMMQGNGWGADESVSTDSADDLNPAVAACNDQYPDSSSFWCVWERRESPLTGSIWASLNAVSEGWQEPESVGQYIHTGGDSAEPGVIVIRNTQTDTAWVTWTCHDTDGWRIQYSCHAGDSWYGPGLAATSTAPIHHARLGRGHDDSYNGCPLLVWETAGDIYYTEYLDGAWSAAQEVAHSESLDRNPDVVSYGWMFDEFGPRITWESTRDGDAAVYVTAADTFSIGRRWCDSTGAGSNFAPCGTPTAYTVDDWRDPLVAWVTDRNGNPDICSRTQFSEEDAHVDDDPASDINPTVSTIGLTQNWCVWQSDRYGNWDLFGSYIYCVGIAEGGKPQAASFKPEQTVVRGVLSVSLQLTANGSQPGIELYDVDGRKVMDLHSGLNDVSGLAPGIYFETVSGVRCTVHARKVVVPR